MQKPRILIVDDDASLRTALFRSLERNGYQVITATCGTEAESLVQGNHKVDLALIDLRLPDGDGIELMQKIRGTSPSTQAIILTGFGSIEIAVEATQKGAYHFITKPFNLDEILSIVNKALSHSQLEQENQQLKSALKGKI
ncbi:MAG: response regulator [Bdellovibrionales bacterium]